MPQQGAGAGTGPSAREAAPNGPATSGSAAGRLEAAQVRTMFDRISGVYDLMNTVMTAGLHHRWRARAAELARVGPGGRVLDVASGTGDLAIELARRVSPGGEVLGSDFSEGMLERARVKAGAAAGFGVRPRFERGDALELPYEDDRFDAATVGFGARNYADLPRGIAEMARVVRPGGRVVILEVTTPTRPPLSLFYRLWFDRIVPALGALAQSLTRATARLRGGDGANGSIADAYAYLPNSVKRWPAPAALAAEMERAGLTEVDYVLMAGGVLRAPSGAGRSDKSRCAP